MNTYFKDQPLYCANLVNNEALKDWKEHQGSLTDKLKTITGSVDLQVLFQNWVRTTWWDRFVPKIKDALVFQREIMMKHAGKSYWYARTVIPQSCYEFNPKLFQRLEVESIRNLIFEEPSVSCANRAYYLVDAQCIEFHWVKKYMKAETGPLWVRLAEYRVQESQSFYLAEILLPDLEVLSCFGTK